MSNALQKSPVTFIQKFSDLTGEYLKTCEVQVPELHGVLVVPIWQHGISSSNVALFFRGPVEPRHLVSVTETMGQAAPVVIDELLGRLFQQQQAAQEQQNNGNSKDPRND